MTNNVNWGEVIEEANSGGGSFENIPDGDYDFVVTNAEATKTKNGKPMYKLEHTVQGGPSNSRKVWDNLVVSAESGTAMKFFFQKMAAIGLPVEFFKGQPSDEQIVQALKGRNFRGKVGTGAPYNGKVSNEIKEYYTGSFGGPSFAPAPVGFPPALAAAPSAPPTTVPQYAAPAAPPAPAPVFPPSQIGAPAPQAAPVYAPPAPAPVQSPWETPAPAAAPAPPTPF